jgi:hypothetical protein
MSRSRIDINECHLVRIPTTALYLDAQMYGKPRTCFGILRLSSGGVSQIKNTIMAIYSMYIQW